MTFEEGQDDGREWRADADPDDLDMLASFDLDAALRAAARVRDFTVAARMLIDWLGLVELADLFGEREQWSVAYLRGFFDGALDEDG